MGNSYNMVGYGRISVDEDMDRDNVSIENQRAIISDFVKNKFPNSHLSFYEDRDRSGYTFEQREGYQAMRRLLMNHTFDILVVKDFSRFSRRNSRGLVELEDLRDAGVRIISIDDGIDYPTYDDWTAIQFRFLVNEMPVTDASKKVKSVVNNRQNKGEWICSAPYGYIINKRKQFEIVPAEAEIIRMIFKLYMEGWGYKKIATYLTTEGYPTPRMGVKERMEADGNTYKGKIVTQWSLVTISEILSNDFYIGTFRQHKFTRKKINGKDIKVDESEHKIFENHHQPIIDFKTFALAQAMREHRSTSSYRGIKKYDNRYSGFLTCGDCGNPMFSLSRKDVEAYHCGLYHRMSLKGCTAHYIRADFLDRVLKTFVNKILDNSQNMMDQLNEDVKAEQKDVSEAEVSTDHLESRVSELKEELKATKRQHIKEVAKHPEREEMIDETYEELENDLIVRIDGLRKQIVLMEDQRNTAIRVGRIALTAMDVFNSILEKDKLDRKDFELLIKKIIVFEDHVEVRLQPDIETILKCHNVEVGGTSANFHYDTNGILTVTLVLRAAKHKDKAIGVNVISSGSPSYITLTQKEQFIFSMLDLSKRINITSP